MASNHFIPIRQPSRQRHNFDLRPFRVKFDTSSVFNGYDNVCKRTLQWKNSLKLNLNRSQKICLERMPTQDFGSLASRTLTL